MAFKTCKIYFNATMSALLVNFFLFAVLPNLVENKFAKNDLESLVPISFERLNPPEPPPISETKKKPPEKKIIKDHIPTVKMQQIMPRQPNLNMEASPLDFEINLKLTGGLKVAKPQNQFKFKGSYAQKEVDQMPVPVFKIKPLYPYRARRLNIAGKVDVKFLVDAKGLVSKISIIKATPSGIFEDSVLKAIATWKFFPGKVRNQQVSTWVITSIEFKPEGI